MFKNAIIALLSTALLFATNPQVQLSAIEHAMYAIVAFLVISEVECWIEDLWNSRARKVWKVKKFKKDVNKITLNAPTKAS